jgi:hypothetical protein
MSLLQLQRISVGQVGVKPGSVKMLTTDNFATITAAGYLNGVGNQLPEVALAPSDVIECMYSYNTLTDTGSLAYFIPSMSNGIITLTVQGNPGDVTLPVVSGHFSVFSGTTGLMHDAGFAPSNPALSTVSMFSGTSAANALAVYADAVGTLKPASTTATLGFSLNVTGTVTGSTGLTATTGNITASAGNLSGLSLLYGATPVAQVDPASCTITAVAGAANTSTITIQLKDGSGTNMARIIPFRVYSSSAADGLTLQSAASTGYSVASGGLSLANGTAVTTQITAMSSATGGCVLSLLDTAKLTSYLVLVLANGTKISAQLSAGSYG